LAFSFEKKSLKAECLPINQRLSAVPGIFDAIFNTLSDRLVIPALPLLFDD
jgi:hypothetical protein